MDVTLNDETRRFIDDQVKAGRYPSPADVIAAAVGRMQSETQRAGDGRTHKTPGVAGGAACVGNTRVPVWTLIGLRRLGRPEQDLLADFPSLTRDDLDAAWAYYREHPAEIDREIAQQENAE